MAAKKSLEVREVNNLLIKIRKIVDHFHHSCLAKAALEARQRQMEKPVKASIADCKKRWN